MRPTAPPTATAGAPLGDRRWAGGGTPVLSRGWRRRDGRKNNLGLRHDVQRCDLRPRRPLRQARRSESGAGQEVARRFFHVGGAAGTVAKTISAYDMTFSDAIYGTADRYVSR